MSRPYRLTELDLRDYQEGALSWARTHPRSVVCLPTGTGKTLVGCAWCCRLLNTTSVDRVLLVEPSRFLVEQVTSYYRTHTNIPTEKLYGTTHSAARADYWTEGVAVVTTPQTAVNDIDHLDFDAVVVDECHHTTGQHAFAQLMRQYDVPSRLGLSATVPQRSEPEIERLVGEIRRWAWTDLPDEHVPDWFGEVYDAPYPRAYEDIVEMLEDFRRDLDGTRLAGLPTLGIRMLSRDGARALQETLERDTKMGDLMGDHLLPHLSACPDLHKLDACKAALADHEFEKAVLFADRVTVARALERELAAYNPVTLLGRLRSGTVAQEQAVEKAKDPATDIVISTSAGEEGIDLPAADLLVVWSNVVNEVRFIQRLGRIMRKTDRDHPKAAVYLATPDSPDYEALRRGLGAASKAGLDIIGIDEDAILSGSIVTRVRDTLELTPLQRDELVDTLGQPERNVDKWVSENVKAGDVFYLYFVPEDLNEWRSAADGFGKAFGVSGDPTDLPDELANNFSPRKQHRYYCRVADIPLLRAEYPNLFAAADTHRLSVSYGSTWNDRSAYREYGSPGDVAQAMIKTLDGADRFYANVSTDSYRPSYAFQVTYHGAATEQVIRAVCQNAAGVAEYLNQRLDSSEETEDTSS